MYGLFITGEPSSNLDTGVNVLHALYELKNATTTNSRWSSAENYPSNHWGKVPQKAPGAAS